MTGKMRSIRSSLLIAVLLLAGCRLATAPPAAEPVPGGQQSRSSRGGSSAREGGGFDHLELAKVLKATPPNGPFWKYGTVTMRMKSKKAGMNPVLFNHWSHRARYTCRVCHLDLGFSMRSGETGITRREYLSGKYCGACHNGAIAFTVQDGPQAECRKCHMENPALLEAAFDKFAASLPQSAFGNGIDWSRALREGKISPRNSLGGEGGG